MIPFQRNGYNFCNVQHSAIGLFSMSHDDVTKCKYFPLYLWPVTGEFPSQRPVTVIWDGIALITVSL